ncbi:MAG: hypothetical protein KBF08_07565 [Kiritimatiellae bacterium]|jgi:hypothetical protein|nr:hypothetical protein [Kiritimatiellia bacterium]
MNKPTTPTPATTTEKHLTAEEKAEIDRNFDGMAQAFAKAEELHRLFIRFSEMAATPKERAEIDRFLESMRRGESGLGLAYDALLLGAKCGRDPAKDAEIQQSQKRLADEMARLADEQAKANEQTARALRHAEKMEDAAREVRERPGEAAGEIVRMVWNQLEAEEKTIALAIQKHAGNMNQAAKSLGKNFSAIRRCRERLRDIYAEAGMELPKWLMNREERTAWKRRQDANPGRTTPSGDLVRTNPNDADDLNNF